MSATTTAPQTFTPADLDAARASLAAKQLPATVEGMREAGARHRACGYARDVAASPAVRGALGDERGDVDPAEHGHPLALAWLEGWDGAAGRAPAFVLGEVVETLVDRLAVVVHLIPGADGEVVYTLATTYGALGGFAGSRLRVLEGREVAVVVVGDVERAVRVAGCAREWGQHGAAARLEVAAWAAEGMTCPHAGAA